MYINYAKQIFKEVRLTTNWTLINKNNYKILLKLNQIQVSIDWPEKIHNEIRWKWNFEKAINSIKILKWKVPINIMMTIHDENFEYFEEVIKIWKDLWVSLWFERITNTWRWKSFIKLSRQNFEKICKIAFKSWIHSTDPVFACLDENRNNYLISNFIQWWCSAWWTSIVIWANWDIFPCARLRLKLWNIKENSLYEIITNSNDLKQLANRNLLKWKCGKCDKKFTCWWCRANAWSFCWDYLEEDKTCIF
jgi:MoaA/NifB/PqqE/SkfB family radical SAM enzyme